MRESRKSPNVRKNEDDQGDEVKVERYDVPFLISLGIYAAFFLIIFVPIIGPLITFIFVPYFAGYMSGKRINKKDGIQIAVLTSVIWSIIEIYILFAFLNSLRFSVIQPGIYTGLDWFVIIVFSLLNVIFCVTGTILSPREKTVEE